MRVKFKSLILVAGMLALGATSSFAQSPEVAGALKALEADRLGSAREALEKAATSSPSAENQFYLGYYYLRLASAEDEGSVKIAEYLDKAKAAFDKGVADDAKSKFPLNKVGQAGVLLGQGKLAEATTLIDQVLSDTKNKDEDVLWRAAEMYTLFTKKGQANDPGKAITLIDQIAGLKKKKDRPEYQLVKGDAYLIKNEGGPAISAYEEALRLQQDTQMAALAYTRMGRVWKRGKNYSSTQTSYNDAIKADEKFAPVYWEFAELWLFAGNYKNAAENLDKYIQYSEESPDVILRYVKFAFLAQQYQKVVDALAKIEGKVNDPDLPRIKGWSLTELGQYEQGAQNLETLLKSNPKKVYPDDYRYLGIDYRELKQDSLAVMNFEKAAAAGDTVFNNYEEVAKIRQAQKRYLDAAKAYEQSIAWKNQRPDKRPTYADFYRKGIAYYQYISSAKDTTVVPQAVESFARMGTMADSTVKANTQLTEEQKESLQGFVTMTPLWQARSNRLFTDRAKALPYYEQYIALADTAKNQKELIEAYQYQAYYEFLVTKDNDKGKEYMRKILALDPENAEANRILNPPAPAVAPKKGAAKPKAGAKASSAPAKN
ncbi:tetratricopeptide repeat protein [Siphonobacter sp.]|uniref:tetratricopeptide repeat protein n=1 Tax=Siphonobacter sp. TaxID=1869184 RepID=UPI003B3BA8E6